MPLRPLSVSEILDGAIAYIRTNPVATLGLSAVVVTITQLVQLPLLVLLAGASADVAVTATSVADLTGLIGAAVVGGLVSAVVGFLATTILTGMLIAVLGEAVLGRRTSLGAAWARVRGRVPGLLGLSLLTTLALGAVLVVGGLPGVLILVADGPGGVLVTVLGVLVAVAAAIFLGVVWALVTPAYVLEGVSMTEAFRRSYRLVRPQWWRVFGVLLLALVLALVITAVLSVPFTLIGGLFGDSVAGGGITAATVLGTVVSTVGAILASTVTAPFQAGVTGLVYIDQRMRRDAFDLELLRAAGYPGPPQA